MVGIIDYKVGNLGSIANMIKYVGGESIIVDTIDKFEGCDRLILPGVGAFDAGMKSFNESGLKEEVFRLVKEEKIPLLGICLGAQLLTNSSEEGELSGLCLIDAETKKFEFENKRILLPHMGWNKIEKKQDHPLLNGLTNDSRFYFVHNFYLKPKFEENILTITNYSFLFSSGIVKDNVAGVQFHPEKSHKFGKTLMENFLNWNPNVE